jgi:hypothetical protein
MAKWLLLSTLAGLLVLVGTCARSIASAVEIGPDEHYEVMKALLWARGYSMYEQVWNDQPPVLTVLLGLAFKLFGPTIGVARAVASIFGIGLMLGCWFWASRQCGIIAGYLSVAYLLVAPEVLKLSVSAMLELPAIAMALIAIFPLLRWKKNRNRYWLLVSGGIFAVAVQTKFTATLVAPALIAEILLASHGADRRKLMTDAFQNLMTWGTCASGAILACGMLLGSDYEQAWVSHFGPQVARQSDGAFNYGITPRLFLEHREALWAAGTGLLVMVFRRDARRLAFPFVWLLTVAIVHLWHHPWWDYYYLHFAVPLAWFAGYGAAEMVCIARDSHLHPTLRPSSRALGALWLAWALGVLLVVIGGGRLILEVHEIQNQKWVEDSALVRKLREYGKRTNWIYTRSTIYAFHAGLLVPPEVAVLPAKRFWSGQITDQQILAVLNRYHPEQLLLSNSPHVSFNAKSLNDSWNELISKQYTLVFEDGINYLYVAKALAEK